MKENITTTQPFAAIVKPSQKTGSKILVMKSPNWFAHQINKFKDNEEVTLIIRNQRPKRSEQQNRYWWVYMTLISERTGHTPEEIHEWVKGKFLTAKIVSIFGSPTRIRRSTTNLSKSEFSELIMRVEAETGIEAPPVESYGL